MEYQELDFRTRAIHAGQRPDPIAGAKTTPIFQTASFAYGSFRRGVEIFAGAADGYLYSRFANPTCAALEAKLADLEAAESAVVVSSGMAAVSAVLLSFLAPSDELLFVGPLYGGTEAMMRQFLPRFGVVTRNASDFDSLENAVNSKTRMIWIETPTNPLLTIHDLADIARIARSRGVLSVVDNTFATPYLTRPLELGCDIVVHSTTKYIGGHGDAIGGAVMGANDLMRPVRSTAMKFLGSCLSPMDASVFLRSLKTLPARMEAHCEGAKIVASALAAFPQVRRVYYPGLATHPNHAVAARQMLRFGGIVSLELHGGYGAAESFLDALALFTQAVSVGDVDSLACHPATTTHSTIGAEARARNGVSDGLVRLSIGLERPRDLVDDLGRALSTVQWTASA
jgi:methionine-gamma-lyase